MLTTSADFDRQVAQVIAALETAARNPSERNMETAREEYQRGRKLVDSIHATGSGDKNLETDPERLAKGKQLEDAATRLRRSLREHGILDDPLDLGGRVTLRAVAGSTRSANDVDVAVDEADLKQLLDGSASAVGGHVVGGAVAWPTVKYVAMETGGRAFEVKDIKSRRNMVTIVVGEWLDESSAFTSR